MINTEKIKAIMESGESRFRQSFIHTETQEAAIHIVNHRGNIMLFIARITGSGSLEKKAFADCTVYSPGQYAPS